MKIFLDDLRNPPDDSWILVREVPEVIRLLKRYPERITDISLDHDLGDDVEYTGYDVLLYIEEEVFYNTFTPVPNIQLHTDNASARIKMKAAVQKIYEMIGR